MSDANAVIKRIAGIIAAWQRTPTAKTYSTELYRQALALRDIAGVLRSYEPPSEG